MSFNPITEAQLAPNRANTQKSTGPVTDEDKSKSSLNAVKTGLTGRTVLLPTDDATIYQKHLDRHLFEFSPLPRGICALDRLEFADSFTDESSSGPKCTLTHKRTSPTSLSRNAALSTTVKPIFVSLRISSAEFNAFGNLNRYQ